MNVCPVCRRAFPDELQRCPQDGARLEAVQPAKPSAQPEQASPSASLSWSAERYLGAVLSGRYRLEQRLGAGSVGVVFRGTDLETGQVVAVKLLMPRGYHEPKASRRLKREFRALVQLDDPHIVKAYDLAETEEQIPYLVMEYVQGRDLGRVLEEEQRLEPVRTLRIAAQILQALQTAHAQGILHRDLKADNIHLVPARQGGERVKVIDFGLVKFFDVGNRAHATALTAMHLVVGTPHYMAPEQIRGAELGPWTDLYALGVLLYRMLSGQLPFPGNEPLQVMRAHVRQTPVALGTLRADLPPELEQLVADLMEKDPQRRPRSAETVLERLLTGELGRLLGPERPEPTEELTQKDPPPAPVVRAEPSYLWLVGLSWAVTLVVAVLVYILLS